MKTRVEKAEYLKKWRAENKEKIKKYYDEVLKNNSCLDCGKKIYHLSKRCHKCNRIYRVKRYIIRWTEESKNRIRGENNVMKRLEVRKKMAKNHNYKEVVRKALLKNKENGLYKRLSIRMKNGGAIKAMLGNNPKPNKPETIVINLIKQNNLPFNYVGDGKIWIRGKDHIFNPDFLSKNPKHIIEVFGDYWHNLSKAKKRDKMRLETYKRYGYKTLIIWEHELKKPSQVLNKINSFVKCP